MTLLPGSDLITAGLTFFSGLLLFFLFPLNCHSAILLLSSHENVKSWQDLWEFGTHLSIVF
jgi:hypothetical protein